MTTLRGDGEGNDAKRTNAALNGIEGKRLAYRTIGDISRRRSQAKAKRARLSLENVYVLSSKRCQLGHAAMLKIKNEFTWGHLRLAIVAPHCS